MSGDLAPSILGVPSQLSAFEHARQLQDFAAAQGFDWPDVADIWAKIYEEIDELAAGIANQDAANTAEEVGDVLFAVTNLARRLGVNPESALAATNQKFIVRFEAMERSAALDGVALADEPIAAQIARYQRAKQLLAQAAAFDPPRTSV
ncbi:MAG: hypothetical protein B7Y53_08265 [Halothiobacillus sp. 28-55-5]|nr:MAG: hypothetical protein B7Y53_08265 [Halothiobacillus sp. 28-55-5]